MITRHPDWVRIMETAVEFALNKPFKRGVDDCIFQISDIIQLYTGVDLAHKFRGKYKTDLEALRLIQSHPGGMLGMVETTMHEFGAMPIELNYAQRGDLIFVQHGDGPLEQGVGLKIHNGVLSAGAEGCRIIPLRQYGIAAWKI